MKKQINLLSMLLLAITALLLQACQNGHFSGRGSRTYVNDARSEFNIAHDTLVVEQGKGNTWLLHRKTGFQVIQNGKPGRHLYETEEWTAVADPNTGILTESRNEKVIEFPDQNSMTVGKRLYRRLN